MASYHQYIGRDCKYGHPLYFQVIEIGGWGQHEERRRGPSCWYADCEEHKRFRAEGQRRR
jgi:hypothetical protein